jgi:DNA polymerase V
MSRRVMKILRSLSPDVEVYSIDEAFLNLAGFRDPERYAENIRRKVEQCTGIPVSVGLSRTKTLAKAASAVGKKTGLDACALLENRDIRRILDNLDVREIWGVGWQYADFLHRKGIHTAGQLSRAEDWWVKKYMTIVGLRTVWELRGRPSISFESMPPSRKAVIVSRQFGRPVTLLPELLEAAGDYATEAVEKLRRQKSAASVFTVFLETNPHKKEEAQYFNSSVMETAAPVSYLPDIIRLVQEGAEKIFRPGFRYRRVGIMVSGIQSVSGRQIDMFRPEAPPEKEQIMKTVDRINRKYGRHTVCSLARGTDQPWKMRREQLSPCYTSKIRDFPVVHAK